MNLEDLPKALHHEGGLSRRLFLAYAASLSSIPLLSRYASAAPAHSFTSDPFTFGVASGDPDHESVILWTRLAPKPLEPRGGMPKASAWVAHDPRGNARCTAAAGAHLSLSLTRTRTVTEKH